MTLTDRMSAASAAASLSWSVGTVVPYSANRYPTPRTVSIMAPAGSIFSRRRFR